MGNITVEQIAAIPANIINGVQTGVEHAYLNISSAWNTVGAGASYGFKQIDKTFRDIDQMENIARVVANSILLRDLTVNSKTFARPITTNIQGLHNTLSGVRVFGSIGYFFNGDFVTDFQNSKPHFIVTHVAFLVGRVGCAANWVVEHKLLPDLSAALTPAYFADVVSKIKSFPVVDVAFIVAFSGIATDSILAISRGEGNAYHYLNIFSLGVNITGNVLSIVASRTSLAATPVLGVSLPVIIAACGVVSNSTAIVAFWIKPAV